MDVARFMVRTNCVVVLNESFNVLINGVSFRIKMTEDSYGPLCILAKDQHGENVNLSSSSDCVSVWSKYNRKEEDDEGHVLEPNPKFYTSGYDDIHISIRDDLEDTLALVDGCSGRSRHNGFVAKDLNSFKKKFKLRNVKEVIGPMGRKLSKLNKRKLGLVTPMVVISSDDPTESFSQPFYFDVLKNNKISTYLSSSKHHNLLKERSEGADSYSARTILCSTLFQILMFDIVTSDFGTT